MRKILWRFFEKKNLKKWSCQKLIVILQFEKFFEMKTTSTKARKSSKIDKRFFKPVPRKLVKLTKYKELVPDPFGLEL